MASNDGEFSTDTASQAIWNISNPTVLELAPLDLQLQSLHMKKLCYISAWKSRRKNCSSKASSFCSNIAATSNPADLASLCPKFHDKVHCKLLTFSRTESKEHVCERL